MPEAFGSFDLLQHIPLELADIVVTQWRSMVTGLTVVHIDYDGMFFLYHSMLSLLIILAPMLKTYFLLRTESEQSWKEKLQC